LTARDLLLHVTERAYNADEMALLSDVFPWRFEPPDRLVREPSRDLTEAVAKAKPESWHQSIYDILVHVARCEAGYLEQAFGPPPEPYPAMGKTLAELLAHLDAVQRRAVACIEALDEAALAEPVPTDFHGESAANLLWVLAQHDVYHGAQIGVLREAIERGAAPRRGQ
jgi:uncharacterized damage-inducible protein DinB